jgi:hypothetical protein
MDPPGAWIAAFDDQLDGAGRLATDLTLQSAKTCQHPPIESSRRGGRTSATPDAKMHPTLGGKTDQGDRSVSNSEVLAHRYRDLGL